MNLGDIIPYTLPPCLNCMAIDPATAVTDVAAVGTASDGPIADQSSVAQAITAAASSTMPQATTSTLPDVVGTANATMPARFVLTPQSLQARLPNIVNPTPRNAAPPCESTFDTWVDQNKLLAIGGLALAAYFLLGGNRR